MEGDAMAEQGALQGRRAIVTGASRGIGRSIALAFAREGGGVALASRNVTELEQLAGEVRALGQRAVVLPCDVTDPEQVRAMVAGAQEQLGGIDILVNNAGMAGSHKFIGHPDELWHQTLALNMTSVYYVTKAAVPTMIEQRWGR